MVGRLTHHVGFNSGGKYAAMTPKPDYVQTPAYTAWKNMIRRCYDQSYQLQKPSYIGCTVIKEWWNFQVFAEWLHSQPNFPGEDCQLDKDAINYANKIYCPEFCSWLPRKINMLFSGTQGSVQGMPHGVRREHNKFEARAQQNGHYVRLGLFNTIEAAEACYKLAKRDECRRLAETYKILIPERVYERMIELANFTPVAIG